VLWISFLALPDQCEFNTLTRNVKQTLADPLNTVKTIDWKEKPRPQTAPTVKDVMDQWSSVRIDTTPPPLPDFK